MLLVITQKKFGAVPPLSVYRHLQGHSKGLGSHLPILYMSIHMYKGFCYFYIDEGAIFWRR